MTQYHYLDDSGDPGLSGAEGSSSHFALAVVQLAERAPLSELAALRRALHFPSTFEFKYHRTTATHKTAFFRSIQVIPFRVRAVVVNKADLDRRFAMLRGQDLIVEFITGLVLRASELDIANDVLIIDGITPAFRRALRIRLSTECHRSGRARPFSKIISGDSNREDGLQLADMLVGAVRHYAMGIASDYYRMFAGKVVDLWEVPSRSK